MKKAYLFPNVITAFGLACGLFVILKVSLSFQGEGYYEVLHTSAILLLVAALLDVLDGVVARLVRGESEFGAVFDSLADVANFGVAPAILMIKSFPIPADSHLLFFAMTGAMIYTICGVLRLVRFNVKANAAKLDPELAHAHKANFIGLPIPAAAAAAVSLNLFLVSSDFVRWVTISDETRAWILIVAMIILGYFMVSRWKFPSIKTVNFRLSSFYLVLLVAIGAVLLLFGILHHFAFVFAGGAWLYIIAAWTLSIIRLVIGRKSATLVEFEPEPDDEETI